MPPLQQPVVIMGSPSSDPFRASPSSRRHSSLSIDVSSHSTSTVAGFNKKSWTLDGSHHDEDYLVAKIQKIQLYLQKVLQARSLHSSGLPSFLPIVKNQSFDGVFSFSLKLRRMNLSEQRKVAAALGEFWQFLRDSTVGVAKSLASEEGDDSSSIGEDIIQLKNLTWMDCSGSLDELFAPILSMDLLEECNFIRVPLDEVDKQVAKYKIENTDM